MKHVRGEAKYILMSCPQQLCAGCVYVFLRRSPDTLRTVALLRAFISQPRNTRTLKYSQGCPKQMLRVAGAVFILYVLLTLNQRCPQRNFLRACSTPDCLKKTWQQELENSCFSAQLVGISDYPKLGSPRGSARPRPGSQGVSLPFSTSSPSPSSVCLCLSGSLAGKAAESRASSPI